MSATTTSKTVSLPTAGGGSRTVSLTEPAPLETSTVPIQSRAVYAAAHLVADPLRSSALSRTTIDWEATLQVRRQLWKLGLGVAESMDTAQRSMGLDAESALRLARLTLAEARAEGGAVVVGIATDRLGEGPHTLEQIRDAYIEQLTEVEEAGGSAVVMASRELARTARSPGDYHAVYAAILDSAAKPVVLHWLGEAFDAALAGYWGGGSRAEAAETVLALIHEHLANVAGIKVSLLDEQLEVELRRRLPDGVRLFTGDDHHYVDLIAGDEHGHSDALLGAFAAVPRFASAALARLDQKDSAGFRRLLTPTVPLSRLIFEAPTQYYKVGVTWLSYLTGTQDHLRMVAGLESGRSVLHLAELFETANNIGLFPDPDLAAHRASTYFQAHGVDAR